MTTMEADALRTYALLVRGGLALVPLDVGYGLVAMEEAAVERIYELKGRPLTKPCVTVATAAIMDEVALPIDAEVRAWILAVSRRTPLAVIAQANPRSRLLASLSPYMHAQATHQGTIALFHNAGPLIQRLAELAMADGRVVVGSSANQSGTGNSVTLAEVPAAMRDGADLVLDHGPAWYGEDARRATTILDLGSGRFLRQGVNFTLIERAWAARQPAPIAATALAS